MTTHEDEHDRSELRRDNDCATELGAYCSIAVRQSVPGRVHGYSLMSTRLIS